MNHHQNPLGEQVKKIFFSRDVLSRLLLVNSLVWLVVYLTRIPAFLMHEPGNATGTLWVDSIIQNTAVPASISDLMNKPWTLLTYMFLHISFWHLFFNMIWLYWFGKIFLEFLKPKQFASIYIVGGISGAVVFVLAFNLFPAFRLSLPNAVALGASASVLAITVATAIMVPDYTLRLLFIGPVKLKHIAIAVIVIDVLMIPSENAGGHFAHLGGALAGVLWSYSLKWNLLRNITNGFYRLQKPFSYFKKKKPLKKVYSNRPLSDEEYNIRRAEKQQHIDQILEKIAKSGYQSLSKAEKELLFSASKKDQ